MVHARAGRAGPAGHWVARNDAFAASLLGSGVVRGACIDIGSNTTRLLVADCDGGALREIHQERSFTRIGRDLRDSGGISPEKLAEVAAVVRRQFETARELGAVTVDGVATAAIRRAENGSDLLGAIESECGLAVNLLSGVEEARLAFLGVAGTLDHRPLGALGVVDVGGGSCELVVGELPDQIRWTTSVELGSGELADDCLHSDPPSAEELASAETRVDEALAEISLPAPDEAVAVGGSATSLRRLAGPLLDAGACARTLDLLSGAPSSEIARRFSLDRERVQLLPAGLLILHRVARLFGMPLQIGRGGVREGVLLEACA